MPPVYNRPVKHYALYVASAGFCALALGACGGGGSGGSIPAASTGSLPAPVVSTSKSLVATAGGSIVLSLPDHGTLALTVPAGALASNATVTLSAYASVPGLPQGSTSLGGFAVDTGGVALNKRLSVSETPATTPSSSTLRLALWSPTRNASSDVDTATLANGALVNDDNAKYVGISTASSQRAYAFYTAPAAASPAPISLAIAASTPGPYTSGTPVTVVASGSDANGNAYVYEPHFSVSNPSLGTIAPSGSNPLAATFAGGNEQMQGAIVVTDTRTSATGRLTINIQSQRPASGGDTYAYSGTLLETDVRSLPSPMPTATTSATLTQTIDVKSGQTLNGATGLYDFSAKQTENTSLQESLSTTDTFEGFGVPGPDGTAPLLEYGTNWADDNGDTLSYLYATPIVVDRLPERAGATWTNSSAVQITENETIDSNGSAFFSRRTYKSDGSYSEVATYPAGYFGAFSPSDHGETTENSDGSGFYAAPVFGAGDIVLSAPQAGGNGYLINYQVFAEASPTPSSVPVVSGSFNAWYNPSSKLYNETDVDNGSKPIPASCHVPATFGSNANQLVQTTSRLDTILGYTEMEATTSYVMNGVGVVCVTLHDVQTSYYDFAGDLPFVFVAAPYQVTTTDQTLGLQSGGTSVIDASQARTTSSAHLSVPYVRAARAQFQRKLERARLLREKNALRFLRRLTSNRAGGAQ